MPSDDWTRTALDVPDRGGALCTAFDVRAPIHKLAGQTLQAETVATPASMLWATLEGFLREVLPVCEESGVELALHPDDPPIAMLVRAATRTPPPLKRLRAQPNPQRTRL